ncbi:multiple cyclophane-containing RiPP AmcA [Nocardiopsis alba]|uniref:multiple cyclophane-containing RiPP AmcA n=1 Tax=Nocardiopsis alba TaxID=53437 RepID=UPI0033FB5500
MTTILTGLEVSDRAADLIDRLQPTTPVGLFDNRDTWDNVGGGPWYHRSTWDNWKK